LSYQELEAMMHKHDARQQTVRTIFPDESIKDKESG
jgi:hypothetical protein